MPGRFPASLLDGDAPSFEEDPMKKALERFVTVALECAIRILPYVTLWILWRLLG